MNDQLDQGSSKIGALIRKRRRQLRLTLQQLGDKSGVSFSYLSQLERNNATPTLGTLAQVAQALGVGIEYFIIAPEPADALTRASQRMHFSINNSAIRYERISAEFPGNELSAFIIHVPPGYRSETVSHEGEEIMFVLEGAITQTVKDRDFHLSVGDSVHYRGAHPHSYRNDSDTMARVLWTGTLTLFHTPGVAAFSPPLNEEVTGSPNG